MQLRFGRGGSVVVGASKRVRRYTFAVVSGVGRLTAMILTVACAAPQMAQNSNNAAQPSSPTLASRDQAAATPPSLAQRAQVVRAVPEGQLTLDVLARDVEGHAVSDLEAADFNLLEDGRPIRSFSFTAPQQDAPQVELVLVIDALTLDLSELERTREQIGSFLTRDQGLLPHPVSIVSLEKNIDKQERSHAAMVKPLGGHSAYLRLFPYSRDGNALNQQLRRSKIYPAPLLGLQGGEGGSERMQLSLEALSLVSDAESHVPGRKLMIWLSPGWPVPPGGDASSQTKLYNEISFLAGGLARARITLYDVNPAGNSQASTTPDTPRSASMVSPGLAGPATSGPLAPGVLGSAPDSPAHAAYSQLTLQALATQSGGEVLDSSNDTAGEIARCAADADNFYSLTYSPAPAARGNIYRALQVRVSKAGVTARTMRGYFWQPQAGKSGEK